MKKKNVVSLLALTSVAVLTLAACGGGNKDAGKDGGKDGDKTAQVDTKKFPEMIVNKDKSIKGGTLKVALPYDTQFQGIFTAALSEDQYDAYLLEPAEQHLLNTDKDFKFDGTGLAEQPEFDTDAKTVTITLKKDLKWSDGEPITADDIIFPYEVIAHKDYTGVRYDDRMQNIEGITEYHDGKADKISGITKKDERTVVIKFKEMNPSIEYGSGLWQDAMPKHYLKDVPVADLVKSDKIRKKPVTAGPFKINNVKTGESVEYVANEYYFKGRPKLDKMVITVVPTSTVADELKAKKYDISLDMPSDTYDSYKKIDGYQNVGREELYYSYIGFKFGHYDKAKTENVMDKNPKMGDVNLRKAIAYSIDTKELGEKVYGGLRTPANSVIIPAFKSLHDKDMKPFAQDVEKAKKILDDAGYKDTDKDGFREDKKGKKLVIKFAAMDGGESAQTIADYYKKCIEDVGLKVEYTNGRLMELNSFYDKVQGDTNDVDMYAAAWGVGTDPNPSESFGRYAEFNMMRFTSDKMDKVLKDISSEKAFDDDYSVKAYKKFQRYIKEEIPVIPLNYNYRISVVNDRVKDYNYSYYTTEDVPNNWFPISLTADKTK